MHLFARDYIWHSEGGFPTPCS